MKKQIALLMLAAGLVVGARAETLRGVVIGVTDGDTVKVLTEDMKTVTVRVAGIDAPEKGQPFGQRSKEHLSALCFQQQAVVTLRTTDKYGRTVGDVKCRSQDVATEQVRAGLAWYYVKYGRGYEALAELEAEARKARQGLWVKDAMAPWVWRQGS